MGEEPASSRHAVPTTLSVTVVRDFSRISPGHMWELICRPRIQKQWLGASSTIALNAGQRFSLSDGGSLWRTGRVVRIRPGLLVAEMLSDRGATTKLTLSVEPVHPPAGPPIARSTTTAGPAAVDNGQPAEAAASVVGPVAPSVSDKVLDQPANSVAEPPAVALTQLVNDPAANDDTFEHVAVPRRRTCRVVITEEGFPEATSREESAAYWRAALGRLSAICSHRNARVASPRQAVILIHGIGEQRPGNTLRNFMRAGTLGASKSTQVKPDRGSRLFELRRVSIGAMPRKNLPTTDVFELYWQHIIRDTTTHQVTTWARRLLLRRHIPRPLRAPWLLVMTLLVVVSAVLIFGVATRASWIASGSLVVVIALFVWRSVGRPLTVNWVGDAARYLSPDPGNVAHRQAIRQEGVDLLTRLHQGGRFDRIVIVGHSLGSVIAYDIITHAWIRMNAEHRSPSRARFGATRAVERAIGADVLAYQATGDDEKRCEIARHGQELQHAAWREQRRNTHPWLVTDLVTVGSPLTYGGFLMSDSEEEFERAKLDRVLPTCPPRTRPDKMPRRRRGPPRQPLPVESNAGAASAKKSANGDPEQPRRCSYEVAYSDPRGGQRTFTVFDHGAPFAVTRWTNLYFPAKWLGLKGDLVGGPIAPQFGCWVHDIKLPPLRGLVSHTRYWESQPTRGTPPPKPQTDAQSGPENDASGAAADRPTDDAERVVVAKSPYDSGAQHIAKLRTAIGPWSRGDLRMLCEALPNWLWAEEGNRTSSE